jgi:tetratricopeptide (TPR) repeat protein
MNLAEQNPFIQRLVDRPYDHETLFAVYRATAEDPKAYASLLVTAAESTREDVAASHWLTEAARVRMHALRDESGTVRLLEAALERDPLNLRAAEQLVELYRAHHEDEELANVLRTRAEALRLRCTQEPVELPRAALAFEKLSGAYEALGDTTAAIAALRTALELERAQGRITTPSPPPDAPPPSSILRAGRDAHSAPVGVAPPPEGRWSAPAERELRDTMPSPVPPVAPARSTRPPTKAPGAATDGPPAASTPPPISSDPLLAVIEALHALRHCEHAVDGAALVLKTALEAIPSAAGFVHVCDVATRDFVVVAAAGTKFSDVVGTRTPETDPILCRALGEAQAVAIDILATSELVGTRWDVVRPVRSILCAPVQFDGRPLGAIELVDPAREAAFTDPDRHAMTYVGERLAEFLSDRSIAF